MKIDDPGALEGLITRLRALRPDAERRWGTLDPGEMLCHLADGNAYLLKGESSFEPGEKMPRRRLLKWVALYSPFPWAKNAQTDASVDPKRDGTRPVDFEEDRERVIEGLRAVAAASEGELAPDHTLFGPMTLEDWHRSAYRHVDHHLRQFGV